jgi:hypothetical protein
VARPIDGEGRQDGFGTGRGSVAIRPGRAERRVSCASLKGCHYREPLPTEFWRDAAGIVQCEAMVSDADSDPKYVPVGRAHLAQRPEELAEVYAAWMPAAQHVSAIAKVVIRQRPTLVVAGSNQQEHLLSA